MKTFSTAYAAHVRRNVTTIARCWSVEKRNGDFILGTELDRDIPITTGPRAGTYSARQGIRGSDARATSDMSVTNMEVDGVVQPAGIPFAFSAEDIRAGQFDSAPVEVFELNYEDPDDFQDVIMSGILGEIRRNTENKLTTEIRGLWQKANQPLGRTDGDACDVVRFGDARCGKNLSGLHRTGTVTAVASRRIFTVSFAAPISASGVVRMWTPFPFTIQVGDTIDAVIGCDRSFGACLYHERTVSFRGHGHWTPGVAAVVRAPQDEIAPAVEVAVPQTLAFGEVKFTSGDNADYEGLIQRVDF